MGERKLCINSELENERNLCESSELRWLGNRVWIVNW